MFVPQHVHPLSPKDHAFGFESHALFKGGASSQFDLSSGAYNAMPRQTKSSSKRGRNLPCAGAETCSSSNCAVGGYFAVWNASDGAENPCSRRD